MKANTLIRLQLLSEQRSEIVFKALEPEARKSPTIRSRAILQKENMFLILKIEAKDTVALRASVNAYLRWIDSMVNVLDVLETL